MSRRNYLSSLFKREQESSALKSVWKQVVRGERHMWATTSTAGVPVNNDVRDIGR
jgi:hypothetical protein